MTFEEKTMKSERIYEGRIINLRVDTVELPNKKYSKREIVEHPGAVGIIAITKDDEVILVKQYRKPIEDTLLEIPAGKLEPKEDPQECAIRELEEETGFATDNVEKISEFYTTPGFSNEVMHIYIAKDLKEGTVNLDDDENIQIIKLPIDEVLYKIKTGEIKDAKTIIAILTYTNLLNH